jgi:putative phosphotransacetylase
MTGNMGNEVVVVKSNMIPVGVSARHVHLSREDLNTLFGDGYELTVYRPLSQPEQYAANEKVNLVGPRGRLDGVRILGPVRSKTQVEISMTDAIKLGIRPPVRDSGAIEGSESLTIEGPNGVVTIEKGAILAQRHIHLSPDAAKELDVTDKQIVSVKTTGPRSLVFNNVLCRVSPSFTREFHIDTDEANAALLCTGDEVELVK